MVQASPWEVRENPSFSGLPGAHNNLCKNACITKITPTDPYSLSQRKPPSVCLLKPHVPYSGLQRHPGYMALRLPTTSHFTSCGGGAGSGLPIPSLISTEQEVSEGLQAYGCTCIRAPMPLMSGHCLAGKALHD